MHEGENETRTVERVECREHGLCEVVCIFLLREVESVHLSVVAPLVEGGRRLVVLESLHDGAVDDDLQIERRKNIASGHCVTARSTGFYLMVGQLATDDAEGVVDTVVVDVHLAQPLRRAARNPASVSVVVNHDRRTRRRNRVLAGRENIHGGTPSHKISQKICSKTLRFHFKSKLPFTLYAQFKAEVKSSVLGKY